MKRTNFLWIAVAMLMAGCAAAPAVSERRDVAVPSVRAAEETTPAVPPEKPPRLFAERELLLDGVRLLNLPDQPDSAKARQVFLSLVERYPQGRWRPAAEAFIRLIDEREAFREASRRDRLLADTDRAEKARVQQEDFALRKTVRELTERLERLQAESLALTRDNEQLKQDIQRMKALEIELEKRERTLR